MGKGKVRRLTFDDGDDGAKRFVLLHRGFLLGGNKPGGKNMEIVRREARVLDKFDAVSRAVDGSDGREFAAGALVLEEPEYEMVKRYFEGTDWVTGISREIVNISDWLAAIPQEDSGG
jgi:hypothetical protein